MPPCPVWGRHAEKGRRIKIAVPKFASLQIACSQCGKSRPTLSRPPAAPSKPRHCPSLEGRAHPGGARGCTHASWPWMRNAEDLTQHRDAVSSRYFPQCRWRRENLPPVQMFRLNANVFAVCLVKRGIYLHRLGKLGVTLGTALRNKPRKFQRLTLQLSRSAKDQMRRHRSHNPIG